ncbi:hypothetical protein [Nitratireductor aestuarii]|nr:hypothetical protein [Nitratireductor aestuarii]
MRRLRTTACLILSGLVLAACSGSDAIDLSQNGPGQSSSQTGATGASMSREAAAAIASARVHFAAAVGTPAEALQPLQDGLNERAREIGLSIETAENATLVVNGYFSTVAEDGGTLIIYVWDVTDKAGNRLHRLQGQHRVSNTSGGWEAVDPATIKRIGERTIDELAGWLSRSKA